MNEPAAGRRGAGVALVAVSAASFGGMAVFARLAYADGTDVTAVLFLRFALAAPCMAAWVAARGLRWPRGATLAGLVAMGGAGYVGQSLAFFTALTLAPASLVALLLYTYPAMVVVVSAVLFGARLTRRRVVALLVALAGTALVVGPEASGRPAGIALGLVAAVVYCGYIVAGSRLTARAGAMASSAVIMAAAACVYGVIAALQRPTFPSTTGSWLAVGAIALVSTVIAISTFFAGLARLGPADASTMSTIEPVVTVVLAWAILNERIEAVQVGGGLLIVAAVVALARTRPPAPEVAPAKA